MSICNQLNHYVPGLAREQAEFRKLLKKPLQFVVTLRMEDQFESAKRAMGDSILLNSFVVTRKSLVITDATGDGFGHILLQKKENIVCEARAEATSRRTGEVTSDTGWVVIQVGSAALNPAWRNYCAVWSWKRPASYGCLVI